MESGQKRLLKNLLFGIFIAVLFIILFYYIQSQIGNPKTIILGVSILGGLFSGFITFLVIFYWDDYKQIIGTLGERIERIKLENPYSRLINKQLEIHWQLRGVFRSILEEFAEKQGGAIVISVRDDDYLARLELCLRYGRDSFEAILRGGSKYKYRPKWFFYDEEFVEYDKHIICKDSKGNLCMSTWKKNYLEKVKKAKFHKKTRIIILPSEIIAEDFSNEYIRNAFLKMNKGIELYWLPEEEMIKVIETDIKWKDIWTQYLQHDYAIVDSLVLKLFAYENSNLLFVSIADQITPYKEIFSQLGLYKSNSLGYKFIFHRITEKGIDKTDWSIWLKNKHT